MALILPPNWCLIFFRDPEGGFTADRLQQILRDARLTVCGDQQPFEVGYKEGPTFYVSIKRGTYIESLIRGLVGRRRKHRKMISGCDSMLEIVLADLEQALDEINTLIEVQVLLQDATRGLMYLSWNQNFSGPED